VKGKKEFSVSADGVVYYLSTAANKELFLKDYKKYEPQYGGWCAYAMGATNEKVEIDPETFKIVNGKLYLFYHSWTNNTLTKWNKDEARLKSNADTNWTKIFH
jgi:YHS domain-containing protein